MTESLVSQIVSDDFELVKKKSRRGRKPKLTGERYLEAVRRTKCMNDSEIGRYLGLNRSTVFYFRKNINNIEIIDEAIRILDDIENVNFDDKYIGREVFEQIPTIENWIDKQILRPVKESTIKKRVNVLYNVCTYLKTHPDNLSLDQVASLVNDVRIKQDKGFPVPFTYLYIRKPIRSFFELVRGISGELLTTKGIDASRSKGSGSQAKERVLREQRRRWENEVVKVIKEYERNDRFVYYKDYDFEMVKLEMLELGYFMYYTATRIGSKVIKDNLGSLSIILNNPKHKLCEDIWHINLKDKGCKGDIEWNKMLIDDGLDKMKDYIINRFGFEYYQLEKRLPQFKTKLFPFFYGKYKLEKKIMKEALIRSGIKTRIPNHIWRHTFAQDFLHATDWNYELCASIGGWKDTSTLKRHYGNMSEEAKKRGLKKAMGLPIEDITYELRW